MTNLTLFGLGLTIIGALCLAWYLWGKHKAKGDQSKSNEEDLKHDEEIASRPNIDNPFGGMQPK